MPRTEAYQLLYCDDDGDVIGLDEVQLLDPIPADRVPKLRTLLEDSDFFTVYQALKVLVAWQDEAGFASGMVFKSLDEALQWARRWLDEAGILARSGDDAGSAASGLNSAGQLPRNGDRLVLTQSPMACGPNSCAMALDTLGYQIDNVDDFVSAFRVDPRWGTDPPRMADDLADMGIPATPRTDLNVAELATQTRHGEPRNWGRQV